VADSASPTGTRASKLPATRRGGNVPTLEEQRDRLDADVFHNILLVCEVGSTSHGISVEGQDDTDWLGIYMESPRHLLGLGEAKTIVLRDQEDGVRSEPGDLDFTLYPLRKWMGLAMKGNPTILSMLFAPVIREYDVGVGEEVALRGSAKAFVSKRAGRAFLGYLDSQYTRLKEGRSMRVNRPELIEQYGYDTKYAAHALRLGLQGIEFLTHGSIRYPMESPYLELVRSVRNGEVSKDTALDLIDHYRWDLVAANESSEVPDEPDWGWANYYLQSAYLRAWAEEAGGYA
jgi:predicted nucleotidyltransferase